MTDAAGSYAVLVPNIRGEDFRIGDKHEDEDLEARMKRCDDCGRERMCQDMNEAEEVSIECGPFEAKDSETFGRKTGESIGLKIGADSLAEAAKLKDSCSTPARLV